MATNAPNDSVQKKRRVCVIGAGTAGLCAIRHCIDQGFDVVAYELANDIGGTWLYSDKVPRTQYEKVHSSLYEQLRTNLPKEIMGFPDFLYPDDCKESFIRAEDVLKFLKSYAEHFKLYPYIKFEHEVMRVRPRSSLVPDWEVYARDLKSGKSTPAYFDFVFVCNGHYSEPMMPEIEGMDIYKGKQLHSHVYRKPSPFKDSKVLVIGAGPSGLDIAHHLNDIASAVYLSQHLKKLPNAETQNSIIFKPDVERFTENGAIFKDGTQEEFSYVIYCTGYQYTFPCISTDSGFRVIDNWVHPLWKHVIVINNPTMALIGVPFKIIPAMSFDLQVRFALKYFTGEKKLPSNEEMLEDMEKDMAMRKEKGWDQKLAHQMADLQFDYYDDLAETAGITKIKPVYYKMMKDCAKKYIYDFVNYRNYCYRLVDDESFVRFPMK